MKRATLTDTKNNLSALVDQVQHGETILILDRGRPVARLESVVGAGDDDPEGRLARLERQGLLRRASDPLPREILMAKAPRAEGASVLEALLDDRRKGR